MKNVFRSTSTCMQKKIKSSVFLPSVIIIACLITPLFAQDCADCDTRPVYVFPLNINTSSLPIPTADHDSILNFHNALSIGSLAAKFLSTTDASKACLYVTTDGIMETMDQDAALAWPEQLKVLADRDHSPGEAEPAPDYWIGGTVIALTTNNLEFHLNLYSASDEKIASASGQIGNYPAGDAYLQVTKAMQAQMAPLYSKIREFENKKRESGAPYAINPTLSVKHKIAMDFGEKSTIHFTLKDCDDVPLKNRHVTIDDCDLGTLDDMAFTTDDNGEADLEYTAPEVTAGIAVIKISYSYAQPWKKPEDLEERNGEVTINIKPPPNSWSMEVHYAIVTQINAQTVTTTRGKVSLSETQTSHSYTIRSNNIAAWLKSMKVSFPGLPDSMIPKHTFIAEKVPLAVDVSAHGVEREQENSFSSSPGYSKTTNNWSDVMSDIKPAITPQFTVSMNNNTHSIHFDGLDGTQTGKYFGTVKSVSAVEGSKNSSSELPADSTTNYNWGTNSVNHDSSWSVHTNPLHGDNNEYQTLKCKWEDTLFHLERTTKLTSDYNFDTSIETTAGDNEKATIRKSEHSRTITTIRIFVEMIYNPGTSDDIATPRQQRLKGYALSPCNSTPGLSGASIHYTMPNSGIVSLKMYNAAGRQVATLVNGHRDAGEHTAIFSTRIHPGGLYFYTLHTGNFIATRKLLLLK